MAVRNRSLPAGRRERRTLRRGASLPWRRLPRPLILLIIFDLLLVAPLPLIWPALFAPAAQAASAQAPGDLALDATAEPLRQPARAASARESRGPLPPSWGTASSGEHDTQRALVVHATRLTWAPRFGAVETIESLDTTPMAGWTELDEAERRQFANMLVGQSILWNLNPQVLLTLLDLQRELNPSPDHATSALRRDLGSHGLEHSVAGLADRLRSALTGPQRESLNLGDGLVYALPDGLDQSSFAVLSALAPYADADQFARLVEGESSFAGNFERRFGDGRSAMRIKLEETPFLSTPFHAPIIITSRFDHHYPLLQADGTMAGHPAGGELGYDGHNGWDYALNSGVPILAAASGYVLFAGTLDNQCETRAGAVILEHDNGFRTLYWHLAGIDVAAGDYLERGEPLGTNGATGCATGPHLHFGVQRLGRDIDPYGWCGPEPDPWAAHPTGARSVFLWRGQADLCPLPAGASVADDSDPTTAALLGERWEPSEAGNNGSAHSTTGKQGSPDSIAIWRPLIPSSGLYRCYMFVPPGAVGAAEVSYHIFHADGEALVQLDQSRTSGSWANLGAYRFIQGQLGRIELRDNDGQPGEQIWADAAACARI